MKTKFNLLFKTFSVLSVAVVLTACGGASSTVDPFKPTRVIGLGDGYNDVGSGSNAPFTVRGTTPAAGVSSAQTVVEQVAYLFGLSNYTGTFVNAATYGSGALPATGTYSYAQDGTQISGTNGLGDQVDSLLADVGTFNSKDLVFISVGTQDLKAAITVSTAVSNLKTQVQRLLTANARHILIMQPLELTNTPWGRANNGSGTYTGKTVEFINQELTALQDLIRQGGYSSNPIIFTNATTLSSDFNIYATSTTGAYLEFSTSTQVPYCWGSTTAPSPDPLTGCAATSGFNDATYDTRLFADGLHLTPAGNRWVAVRVFNATAAGWR
jgi:phospholipase/lecithinase/hemolysin